MTNEILIRLWKARWQFVRYFSTGLSAILLDMGSLFILKEFAGFTPLRAVVLSQVFITTYVFLINKFWSFGAKGGAKKQAAKFYALAAFNYSFSIFWMWLFNKNMGFNYLLVRLANIALAVAWNFLLYKYWVYKKTVVEQII